MKNKFIIDCDHDCHYFVIPVSKMKEWNEWLDLPGNDPRCDEVPSFCWPIGGSICLVVFESPMIENIDIYKELRDEDVCV